ncbi:PREDICTED: GFP-like fluorescent chromoprotein dsFP483 [Branchiostoma belcheri]|uniref:GFP-like fluorescent chromoprotein dsFP483 n=1 Tax=Branchiostoma belcheri TaxID=7741 RepID=A0A6P5A0Y1_BRABE|nr:PREDICTED: GFP-like fluorescent chromoprotein dsFP483 [Branchiostoma belcheri]
MTILHVFPQPVPATHELHVSGSINGREFDLAGRGTGNPVPATHELHVSGSINGREFDLAGRGTGNAKDGSEEIQVKSTKGALGFSPVLLVPNLGYGFHQYLPYPDGMSPFQAAADDGSGYVVHRTLQFEDGGSVTGIYRYSYDGSHIKGEFNVTGSGFPADGPVMTNSLTAVDPSVATVFCPNDTTVVSTIDWSCTTTSGKRYHGTVRTNYTFAKPIAASFLQQQPMFVFRKTELKASDTELSLKESQKAFHGL